MYFLKRKAPERELVRKKAKLGWPLEPTFLVPDEVRAYLQERTRAKKEDRSAADVAFKQWRETNPDLAEAWDAAREGRVPANLGAFLAEG
ncbi:MAG: hypothetical protein IH935_12120, partial [Acidobacteria bacterium]|nr:hypothetical protein [Acidobacteriota bacterium]